MRLVVARLSEQHNQILSGVLRASIWPKTIVHKTGWRRYDCAPTLVVLVEGIIKVAHHLAGSPPRLQHPMC